VEADAAETVEEAGNFAREHQITQIVIGSSKQSRWQQLTGGGSNVARIIREAGAFGIDVHVIARSDPGSPAVAEVSAS
jgi:K+-sensing histidine kinase KdpD